MITCATAILAVGALSGCDAAGPVQSNPRQVTVVGSGQVQGMPDTLTADVGIEVTAPDVTSAMNQTSERQRAVIDALNARGIDAKDISTTSVSLQPSYGENSAVTGYRADNSIRVTIRELDGASATLATVVTAGGNATRINSVSYSIDDDSALIRDARARAFNDAESRARQYAELAGLSLGKVISISETGGSIPTPSPVPMPRGAPMAADVPLSPGQQTVGFSVSAVWELT
jgi:uncharacterized protein YggE